MSQSEVREITQDARERRKRRFDARDFNTIAEFIGDTLESRKQARKDLERLWTEIDRQVRMEPDTGHKLDAAGQPDPKKAWLPEIELPWQAQTLEMLTADARRMMFPTTGSWYRPHAELTDEFLREVDLSGIIGGDESQVPVRINQDAADHLVQGVIDLWHRQYDFFGHIDLINAEAFQYGFGVGRGRMVSKRIFVNTAKGVVKLDQKIPVLYPVSIRNTYLDDSEHRLMNEGFLTGPSVIREWKQVLSDVVMAARRGLTNPESEAGGWMPKSLAGLNGDKDGQVTLIEMEGDFIVGRKTQTDIYIPNAIATVIVGRKGKNESATRVIRFRFKRDPFTSYVEFPYHRENIDSPYASGPMMKGYPIQKTAAQALSRTMETAALRASPPVSYDRDDQEMAARGGAVVEPYAQWPSTGSVQPHEIGDPAAMFNIFAGLRQEYADVTGITAPRLGAQTVSHTTAFAKEAELERGTIRTVDYVRSAMKGALTQWLSMAWSMGLREMRTAQPVFLDAYNGWVEVSRSELPQTVLFEVHGSGGPAEEAQRQQQRLQSMQLALQLDQMNVQMGGQPAMDLPALIEQVLSRGGWTDIDAFMRAEATVGAPPQFGGAQPGVVTQGIDR